MRRTLILYIFASLLWVSITADLLGNIENFRGEILGEIDHNKISKSFMRILGKDFTNSLPTKIMVPEMNLERLMIKTEETEVTLNYGDLTHRLSYLSQEVDDYVQFIICLRIAITGSIPLSISLTKYKKNGNKRRKIHNKYSAHYEIKSGTIEIDFFIDNNDVTTTACYIAFYQAFALDIDCKYYTHPTKSNPSNNPFVKYFLKNFQREFLGKLQEGLRNTFLQLRSPSFMCYEEIEPDTSEEEEDSFGEEASSSGEEFSSSEKEWDSSDSE